jgi:hypothetical protein
VCYMFHIFINFFLRLHLDDASVAVCYAITGVLDGGSVCG